MDIKYQKAINEVMQLVGYFNEEEKSKIPTNLLNFFEKNQVQSENIVYPDIPLTDQNISNEAKALLTYMNKYL